jgi:NAD-reducing hydrogenase small subunit
MERVRLATVWLGGCSGCHMSFLDLDEFLVDLAGRIDLVYSPLVDIKEYPEGVDLVLVEGAVANLENRAMLQTVRARSRVLVAFGDCAVTGNVTAMRNPLGPARVVLERAYVDLAPPGSTIPHASDLLPELLDRVLPLHAVVPVDVFLPGCPPPAPRIREVLTQFLDTGQVRLAAEEIRFG